MVLLTACAGPRLSAVTPSGALKKLPPSSYPALLDGGDPGALAKSVAHSLDYFSKLPPDRVIVFGTQRYDVSETVSSLSAFKEFLDSGPSHALLKEYVAGHFDVYESSGSDGRGTVLYTGYYTPELSARSAPDDDYRFPVYRLPDDIVTADLGLFREKYKGEKIAGLMSEGRFIPYYTRRDIDAGALTGHSLELAWCSDPVELFFMQVQGSGVLTYSDGTVKHANYAGANGRRYRSIGRLLIEQGKATLDVMSLNWIRDYLTAHPDEAPDILNYNESYVFFRLEDDGPFASTGVVVTPERTIAVDDSLFPPGALAFIETETPAFKGGDAPSGWEPYSRFVMAQDAGGAIKTPGRADIYFGTGDEARQKAGYMRRKGRLYFLAGKR